MKAIKILILSFVLSSITWIAPQKASAQISIDFQIFYDDLSPYGDWVDNSDYGYVWLPNVSRGFTPYGTNGHWIYTYAGWTWVSNYSWGWAPFHYGRWFYDDYYGWLWAPDNEWGPGWVTWRRSDDYYGWAPIGPGISINIAYSSGYNLPYNQWTFVRNRDFGRTNITNYYINTSNYTTIINNTTVINNIQVDNSSSVRYNTGPDRNEVQRQTGTTFAPVAMKERNDPGQSLSNNELQIYKPRVERNNTGGRNPAPTKVANLKDVKPQMQRSTETQPQRNEQPVKQQPAQQQRNEQPAKQKSVQQQRNEQPVQQQRNEQPTKQQQEKQQPVKQQSAPQQRNEQPAKQKPVQQQRNEQPAKQKSVQQQPNEQPAQQQRNEPPAKQQPEQQQRNEPPVKQQPAQQQRSEPPAKQQRNEPPAKQQQEKQQPNDNKPAKGQQRSDTSKNN